MDLGSVSSSRNRHLGAVLLEMDEQILLDTVVVPDARYKRNCNRGFI